MKKGSSIVAVEKKAVSRPKKAVKSLSPEHPDAYRLYCLAEKIRNESRNTIYSIVSIGRSLIDAQAILKEDGLWVGWLKEEFQWSHQTAYNFINAAKLVDRYPDLLQGELPPSAIYLLSNASDAEIKEVIEKAEEGGMTRGNALRTVRNHRWREAVDELVKSDVGAAYIEIEKKMQDPYYHEAAVAAFKQFEELFSELAGEDAATLEIDVGMILEERNPPVDPGELPPNCQLDESADGVKVIMWADACPYTLAIFPRRLPPVALAWRNAALAAVVQRLRVKVWEETL